MKAREIMTENPDVLRPDDPVSRAAQLMRDGDYGAVPVVDDNMHLSGVITDRDIAIRCVAEGHGSDCRVSEHMSRDRLATAGPDEDVDGIMRKMRDARVRRMPVVDNDRVVGIIAQADLALEADDEREVEKTVERISEPSR